MNEVKEIAVMRDNLQEFFSIIEKELKQNMNTQVYVSANAIAIFLKDIQKKTEKSIKANWGETQNQGIPRVDFVVRDGPTGYEDVILEIAFEFNTNDYYHLVRFVSKDLNYISYLVSFKQLLLIQLK